MTTHFSTQLSLLLQDLDNAPDTWGDILNTSTLELLEDSIAGMSDVVLLTAADYTMDATKGADDGVLDAHYRKMIVHITGDPQGDTNVLAPDTTSLGANATGIYLVHNDTTGGDAITFKTVNGNGIILDNGVATWCWCDGTDIIGAHAATAGNSNTTTLATDSLALGGIDAADYAALGLAQAFTAGQHTTRVTLTDDTSQITPDLDLSNAFYALWEGDYTLMAPANPNNGATFSLVIEQDDPAHTISYATPNIFIFPGGVAPVLSVGAGDVDFFAFERVQLSIGSRWLCTSVKDWKAAP